MDESGNRATTSYFTEFGFGNIADVIDDLSRQIDDLQQQLVEPAGSPPQGHRPRHETADGPLPGRGVADASGAGWPSRQPRSATAQDPAEQTGPRRGPVCFNSVFVDRAPLELQAGTIDMYLYGLSTEAAQELHDADGVQLFQAPATTLSLVLNPAPAPEGKLNPFAIPEVRRAMQYLVNRDFIAQDLYRGLAQPMITHVSPSDYDFLTVYDIDRGSGIRYDPEYARQQIADAMTAAGAELVGRASGATRRRAHPAQVHRPRGGRAAGDR